MTTQLRIGIDARFHGPEATGLGRYAQELISHLARLDMPHQLVVWTRPEAARDLRSVEPLVEVHQTRAGYYTAREQITFGGELRRARLDLMHFVNFNFPLSYRRPFVTTIPDLTLLDYPETLADRFVKLPPARAVMRASVRRSRRLLTFSAHQKRLIADRYAIDPARVRVVHAGVGDQFAPPVPARVAALRNQLGIAGPIVMYAGRWREHKNVECLIEAFRLVRDRAEAQLVLVGEIDKPLRRIRAAIAEHGLQGNVVLTGFLDDDDLIACYGAADVFAFPSLEEGFGLPPLEAMACGAPVAASRAAAIPEVLGDAADWFDPLDVRDIAAVVVRLLLDPERRARARARGFAQARRYSWERTAKDTLGAYEEVLTTGADRPA